MFMNRPLECYGLRELGSWQRAGFGGRSKVAMPAKPQTGNLGHGHSRQRAGRPRLSATTHSRSREVPPRSPSNPRAASPAKSVHSDTFP
jgi:hypothetical protein